MRRRRSLRAELILFGACLAALATLYTWLVVLLQ